MKQHSTNYTNTFIIIADDCPTEIAIIPPLKNEDKTIALMQFEMISNNPYKYTSDEVIFECYAIKNSISKNQYSIEKELFFSKGQPCLRTSALTKRYGWGIHYNSEGKMAIYGAETKEYAKYSSNKSLKVIKAMKSRK